MQESEVAEWNEASAVVDRAVAEVLEPAIESACRRIAPLWPLKHFVAVNPFVGMSDLEFRVAAGVVWRTAHGAITQPADNYRHAWETGKITEVDLREAMHLIGWNGTTDSLAAGLDVASSDDDWVWTNAAKKRAKTNAATSQSIAVAGMAPAIGTTPAKSSFAPEWNRNTKPQAATLAPTAKPSSTGFLAAARVVTVVTPIATTAINTQIPGSEASGKPIIHAKLKTPTKQNAKIANPLVTFPSAEPDSSARNAAFCRTASPVFKKAYAL